MPPVQVSAFEQLAAAAEELKVALQAASDHEAQLQNRLREAECSGDKKIQRFAERTAKVWVSGT